MSTALNLASLAAQGELKIPIARGVVSQGGSGTDYTGWSGVSSVFVEAKVEVREQSRGFATLTLTVEGSSNGADWSTLQTFTFGHGGTQSATVSSPADHLRVSWDVGGGSEWQIIEVTAAPSIIDTAGGGSFNGGTITDGLTVHPDTDEAALKIVEATGGSAAVFNVTEAGGVSSYIFVKRGEAIDLCITPLTGKNTLAVEEDSLTWKDGNGDYLLTCQVGQVFLGAQGEVFLTPSGALATSRHTAPADGDLNAGECAFWFDQTDGAAKLKIKGKTANGTVAVGEVALS